MKITLKFFAGILALNLVFCSHSHPSIEMEDAENCVLQYAKKLEPESPPLCFDKERISSYFSQLPWHDSHGISKEGLGAGAVYYGLVHAHQPKLIVCLGSGGGTVPSLLRQAQRDLNQSNTYQTILVDGNMGHWGRPKWLNSDSFFRTNYPDIEIILDTTAATAKRKRGSWNINYLHIDADHSFKGSFQDFKDYFPMMAPYGIIVMHDTGWLNKDHRGPCYKTYLAVKQLATKLDFEIINFDRSGCGFAVLYLGEKGGATWDLEDHHDN